MKRLSPRSLAIAAALAAMAAAGLRAEAAEEKAAADETYSWDEAREGISFTTRIAGRRIPDYLRDLLENARQLGADVADGPPPPATLAQLRRRAQEDEKRLDEVLRSEGYYNGSISSSVRQAQGGDFEVVYLVVLGTRTMIERFDIVYSGHEGGGEGRPGSNRARRRRRSASSTSRRRR